ncbi:hypothetical protein K435DRAFT_801766 [Dendrothele bispora CBS 962.96]|uniref:Carbohydrate-binding module family 19 domain-containing protein n=1 Tax=Dendrothele bispora (strain CBS 962.96) TaxID=1314807 RepID=A0A4V4HED8_DENBC|nr:hypothetical protein K435DRAFT_801766 [Dendrothele bispora CBS 962.96]
MRAAFVTLALALAVAARPSPLNRFSARQDNVALQNGKDAIALNDKFKTLTADSPCQAGDQACINGGFAQCVNGKFVVQQCAGGTTCAALPLVNSAGTTIACTTQADIDQRIAATGATDAGAAAGGNAGADNNTGNNNAGTGNAAGGAGANNAGAGGAAGADDSDPQKSLTLDPKVIADFANDGQDVPEAGQVPSLTSTNNFINFCLTRPDLPLTNGQQIRTGGSCNPAPIGLIPDVSQMPSSKFVNPVNQQQIPADTSFTITMAINNLETGFFVNANEKYFAAPQQLNAQGLIQGHSHVVVEQVTSFNQTTPNDPTKFAFFKGLNAKAANGVLSATVDKGLPAGFYKLSSINAAANHQPVIVPVAQHASLDDTVYFEVTA